MADFCSLCGYGDINIEDVYNTHIKPTLLEDIKTLEDVYSIQVGVGGVCEHCGIIGITVNNKYEVFGRYYAEDSHKIGVINKDTIELEIFENDEKYSEQRLKMEKELKVFRIEFDVINKYKIDNNKEFEDLTAEDLINIGILYQNELNKLE